MKDINVGIIGLGVGERHLVSYQSIEGVNVKSICDFNENKMDEIAGKYSIPEKYTDWKSIVNDDDINVISICSYDNYHAEQCIEALKNGKHIMVEKPIALNKTELYEIVKAQQDSNLYVTSNLILRKSPRFAEVKEKCDSGLYGDLFYVEGGYIHNILWKITEGWRGKMDFYSTIYGGGIHIIDLVRWIVNDEVSEVTGLSNNILTKNTKYKFDDTFINLFKFNNGVLGKCLSTYGPQRPKFHSLNVYGTKGTFLNDVPVAKEYFNDEIENELKITTPYPGMEKGDLIPDFIDSIKAGTMPIVNHIDVFRVMDICCASLESISKNKTLKVEYII